MAPVNRKKPVRAITSELQYTLMEFMREFSGDATCLEWLWRNRYSADVTHAECSKCQQVRQFSRYATAQQRQSWTCTACGHHLHPTAGTIFHKSSTSLHLWFYAMYLMTSTRCGISAKQLERELGVTYKTAWRMAHLVRNKLMAQDGGPLTGGQPVEIDETYVGGRPRYYLSGRSRDGRPKGDGGVFHSVSKKHLQSYLNEYAWRYKPAAQIARAVSVTSASIHACLISPVWRLSSDC
jgi:transposase-like protein